MSWHGHLFPARPGPSLWRAAAPRLGLGAAAPLRTQPGFSVFFHVFPVVLPTGAMTVLPTDDTEASLSLLPVPG